MWCSALQAVLPGIRPGYRRLVAQFRRCQSTASVERVIETLQRRGLVNQHTRVSSEDVPAESSVYVGFDPTADSLHTGNLIAIIALLHFTVHGYQPIAVVGGATGCVGDPSGRSSERDKLSLGSLELNIAGIEANIKKIFSNFKKLYSPNNCKELIVVNNSSWWDKIDGVGFVSDIARHFRLSSMLNKESVKQRLASDEGMSCAEFLYPIFQSYDFLQLNKRCNCTMQLGGGDQWGNITAGCEFVRKATGNIVHGLTLPLLTTASGEKLSKSTGNAVWLSHDKTSPFEFYQSFVNTPDQIVRQWLKYFSFLTLDEIEAVLKQHQESPSSYTAQKCLAEHVTRLVHGEAGLEKALNGTAVLFGKENGVEALGKLSEADLQQLFHNVPTAELPLSLASSGEHSIVDLVAQSGIVESRRNAESLVQRGGLYVNLRRVSSAQERLDSTYLLPGDITLFRIGKKNYKIIKWR